MKTQMTSAIFAILTLTACNETVVNPVVSGVSSLKFEACHVASRMAAIGVYTDYVTVQNGLWSDPSTWQGGLIPATGSTGSVTVNHAVVYDAAISGTAFTFNGKLSVLNAGSGLTFIGTTSTTIAGEVSVETSLMMDGSLIIQLGKLSLAAGSNASFQNALTVKNSIGTSSIRGTLQVGNDWNILDQTIVIAYDTAAIHVGDDLLIGDIASLDNRIVAACDNAVFTVGDVIIINSNAATIIGSGTILVGTGISNGDNNIQYYDILTSHVYGGENYARQVKSSNGMPILVNQNDPAFPNVPHCTGALPVTLIGWSAKFQAPSSVVIDWTTTSESNAGFYEIKVIEPCQNFSTAYRVATRAAVGNSNAVQKYSQVISLPVTAKGGQYYYQLLQYGADGKLEETFGTKSVKVGN